MGVKRRLLMHYQIAGRFVFQTFYSIFCEEKGIDGASELRKKI